MRVIGAAVLLCAVACHGAKAPMGTYRQRADSGKETISSGLPLAEQIGNQIDSNLFDSTGDDTADAKKHLGRMDANGDGKADLSEVTAFVLSLIHI